MAYAVITREKMQSEWDASKLISLKYRPSGADAPIQNGNVVVPGALIEGLREVYSADKPASDTPLKKIVIITTPEVMTERSKKSLSDFRNEAGEIARGDRLMSGDIFSVTAEALSAAETIAAGDLVELQADTKLKVVKTATTNATSVGTILDILNDKYAIQVM